MKTLQKNITSLYGEQGESWLTSLPNALATLQQQLNITLDKPFPNLTYHYVAPAENRDSHQLVLKYGYPNNRLTDEIEALKHFAGNGMVKLINANAIKGWLLIEHCIPGETIDKLEDDEATTIAVQIMQSLWKPIEGNDYPFNHIADWLQNLDNPPATSSSISTAVIANAQAMCVELLAPLGEKVLLHGDLHHHNILTAKRATHLAIDPKGIIGEREYEVGALLRNPLTSISTSMDWRSKTQRRLTIIKELTNFENERLIMWSYVQAILAARWHEQDGTNGIRQMLDHADMLYTLL